MRPPKHRADATAVYISPFDPGWDHDRIESETEAMEAAGEDPTDHPYVQHIRGYTRFDLDAPHTVCGEVRCAREYVGADAVQWTLKRLDWEQWDEVYAEWSRAVRADEPPLKAYAKALRYSLKKVEGPGAPDLDGIGRHLTHKDMQTLHELSQSGEARFQGIRNLLGQAAFAASEPLSEVEGKR